MRLYLYINFNKFDKNGFGSASMSLGPLNSNSTEPSKVKPWGVKKCNGFAQAAYGTSQGFDVGKSDYILDSTKNNYAQITKYDSLKKEVSGKYQLTFKKTTFNYKDDPMVVEFKNGTFITPIGSKRNDKYE